MNLEDYRQFTHRLQTNLEQDARVLGLIALGSMAEINRVPDEWSDHDFFVITVPGDQEAFRRDLGWLPDQDRIVLNIRETAHGLKILYDSGHLLEFAIFDLDELGVAHANDYRVLLDRADIAAAMARIAQVPPAPAPYDATRDFTMVVALLYIGAGRCVRGERLSAHMFIKVYTLHHLLPMLTRLLDSDHKARLDNLDPFRRFEQVFPQVGAEIDRALLLPPLEAAQILLAIAERHARPVLADYPAQAVEVVRHFLDQVHTT
jgi:hypothetical protein